MPQKFKEIATMIENIEPVSARYVTAEAAAGYLGVSVRTVRRMVETGELNGYRLGDRKTLRIDVHDLDALVRPITVRA